MRIYLPSLFAKFAFSGTAHPSYFWKDLLSLVRKLLRSAHSFDLSNESIALLTSR